MYKRYSILVALLIVLLISGAANANLFSVENTSGDEIYINTSGQLLGMKGYTESATTNDTVTTAESGKTFLVDPASAATFTLPTAAAGLQYTFIVIDGDAGGVGGRGKIILDPQSTDTFVGCVSSTATTTFAAGDSLISPGATGDSVTIIGASTRWYCTQRTGTWVDNN